MLVMALTVLHIMLAIAVPAWTHFVQREREEEMIFRGLQYAEAIRVFQRRTGRYPNRLEELVEIEPRSIRQLFKDPLGPSGGSGEWGLLVLSAAPPPGQRQPGQPAPPGQPPAPGQPPQPPGAQPPGSGLPPRVGGLPPNLIPVPPRPGKGPHPPRVTGPIMGVYSGATGTAIKSFLGRDSYSQWQFTVPLIKLPAVAGGNAPLPRVSSEWIGRPFRGLLGPQAGGGPQAGQPLTPRPGPGQRNG
jgi:type II secretory pathway pseudopilin PulG